MAMNTATMWAFTINNPTEEMYALVKQGYPDYLRALIYTNEVGKDGTPHIQGWMKLQKQQRLSFCKKLFPTAHFTPLTNAEYELNTRRYVQKDDNTTDGAHIQQFNDPIPDAISLLKKLCRSYINFVLEVDDAATANTARDNERIVEKMHDNKALLLHIRKDEKEMVYHSPSVAKIFVSPMYNKVKKEYLQEIFSHELHKTEDADDDETQEAPSGLLEWEYQQAAIEECVSEGEEDGDGEDDSDGVEDVEDGDSESDQGDGGD